MKILVTGGAGYLGAVLVPKLLRSNHTVTVLDSFQHNVPSLAAVSRDRALRMVRGDIVHEPGLFHRLAAEADAVVHLAAIVGAPACSADPGLTTLTNQHATEELVAHMCPDQTLIFPCTNSGYGKGGAAPMTEADPMTPLSIYGRTKVAAEAVVLRHPLGVSLRFGTLYGPSARMRLDLLVNDFVWYAAKKVAWRQGGVEIPLGIYEPGFRRCVLHVSDAAEAIVRALHRVRDLRGRPWNVGAENVTKAELADRIAQQVPGFRWREASGRDPDQRDYVVSSDTFRTATGWAPSVALNDGIAELLRLYQQPFDAFPSQWRNVPSAPRPAP